MRITTNMMTTSITGYMFKQSQQLLDAQTRLATQKAINRISEDPLGMAEILDYRAKLSSIDQYNENIAIGKSWIELTETTLESVQSQIKEVIRLAEEYSCGSEEDRASAVEMVKELYDQIMSMANTPYGDGRYLFSGSETGTAPFSRNDYYEAQYYGNTEEINVITGEDIESTINVTGDVFFFDENLNVFDVMEELIGGLENSDTTAGAEVISEQIARLQDISSQVESSAIEISVAYQCLELSEDRLSSLESNIEGLLNGVENVDVNEVAVELQTLQTAYETTLEVAAMITSQKSLIDFL